MTLLFQLINDCNNVEQWLKEKVQQQNSYPKNIDPILWSSDIKGASEHLQKYDAFPF
jgi:heat shock protein 4